MDASEKLRSHIPALLSLWRGNSKKSPLNQSELKSVSESLLRLQRGLTGERNLVGASYMENKSQLGAYLLYYWPVTYMQISSALNLSPDFNLFREKKSISILDVGSGPGPASFAVCDFLCKSGVKSAPSLSVTLLDSSEKALSLAKKIFSSELPSIKVSSLQVDLQKDFLPPEDSFDIIVMSHALNELWKNDANRISRRTDFLLRISKSLSNELDGECGGGGVLILSEPALLETSRNLICVRDNLIEKGFSILAPCLKNKKCPALSAGENHTCHAEIKWSPCEPVASIARNAKLDRDSVKASFFIMRKNAESKSVLENDDAGGDKNGLRFRIVSDGMLNKSGRVRFLICDGERRIPLSAKRDESHAKDIGFFSLHRYDLISLENPEKRGDGENVAYGIQSGTNLRVSSNQ